MTEVALVTGAGRGIGREIARKLASAGFAVALTARSEDQIEETAALIRAAGGRALAVPADVLDAQEVAAVCTTVAEALGPVDVLVNNAGISGEMRPFLDTAPADWWRVLETNLRAPALFSRQVLPAMVARGSGHVVNINSLQGSDGAGSPPAYGVSKAALMRFTDSLAAELAGTGVTVVDLSPGLVRTAMTRDRADLAAVPDEKWQPPQKAAEQVLALVSGGYEELHGRFVHATDDLAELLVRVRENTAAGDGDLRVLRLRR